MLLHSTAVRCACHNFTGRHRNTNGRVHHPAICVYDANGAYIPAFPK